MAMLRQLLNLDNNFSPKHIWSGVFLLDRHHYLTAGLRGYFV
jgi:hypothetical protein